jgi:hypothetical protein
VHARSPQLTIAAAASEQPFEEDQWVRRAGVTIVLMAVLLCVAAFSRAAR